MSSSERAPEPTMEDILASIRRIITDDETGQATQATAEAQAQKAPAESGPVASEADSEIISDIENVLGGAAEAQGADEEEILDLTAELGGLEIVEDDVQEVAEVTEVTEVFDLDATAPDAPVFKPSEPDDAQTATVPMADPQQVPVSPEAAAQMAVPEAPIAPDMQQPAEPEQTLSASEEAATALERAIAALKAGQAPASDTQAEPFQFQAAPEPEASLEQAQQEGLDTTLTPMTDPAAIADTHPDPEAQSEPAMEPNLEVQPETTPPLEPLEPEQGTETDLVLTEGQFEETFVEEIAAEKAPFWPAQESQAQEEPATAAEEETSSEEPSLVTEPQPEPVFASATEEAKDMAVSETNGASGAHLGEASARSLEDSIKDMLRPMLRQWLDENMPRMIREELDTDALRRQQD